MSDVFVANDAVADVQVRSNRQLYIFGKGRGETTVYATGANGKVVYAANVRVGNNLGSVDEMLRLAMPEANVRATPMNNLVLLTGTVSSPTDVEEAQRLVQAYVGEGTQVVSRLRSATPLQVNLKVRIAEVNRSLLKQVGVNLLTKDLTGGFQFGIGQGNPGTITGAGKTFNVSSVGTTLGAAGKLFGLDILSTLDLAESDGALGRNRKLPRRRRIPDPDLAVARLDLDRVQAVRCRSRLHADRPCGWPDLDARPSRSQRAFERRQRQDWRLHRASADDPPC
jgi:pilus assembly protein CpaC